MIFRPGDRVRVKHPRSEYTGCRGTIMMADDPSASEQGVLAFGHYVAIDGEVGAPRPFLLDDLEPIRGHSVRPAGETAKRKIDNRA